MMICGVEKLSSLRGSTNISQIDHTISLHLRNSKLDLLRLNKPTGLAKGPPFTSNLTGRRLKSKPASIVKFIEKPSE
ncbi:hypothetical protein MTR_8g064940 [Medicago truncatula]|uniref:Uncharacterized protein n=1 Tax=Medicago truncatula TaxID=3880 RepID=A0A072U2L3_MEDTR|nr:hypothetical protein MTR_8g064940 [Medicago truncatula]